VAAHHVITEVRRLRQEDQELEANLKTENKQTQKRKQNKVTKITVKHKVE
jgi:hypothetical protein